MAGIGVFEALTAAFASGAAALTAYSLARRDVSQAGSSVLSPGLGRERPVAKAGRSERPAGVPLDLDAAPDPTAHRAPYPIWRADHSGQVLWSNDAFKELLLDAAKGACPFGEGSFSNALNGGRERHCVLDAEGAPRWFDLYRVRADESLIHYATPADDVVRAEAAQRTFVQTLTKTFAQLSIGLAVFDRQRQLALFNPALIDLTQLPASFLSARPYIASFFDRLRDNRMMPEPRDYPSWRDRIASLEAAARHGEYAETWTLDTGQTFRISGRPHPDGALAFTIEDISAEITATRQFRDQLQLAQSVLDGLDAAIAVFAPSGLLLLCNSRYGRLWDLAPENAFADTTVSDAHARWTGLGRPGDVWDRLRDYVLDLSDRTEWSARVALRDGRHLHGHFAPLQGSRTLVVFSQHSAATAPSPELGRGEAPTVA